MKRLALTKLETALRTEAKTIRGHNGFSRLLHERCMDALRRRGLRTAAAEPANSGGLWRIVVPVGVAAAAALAAWLVLRTPQTPQTPAPRIADPIVPVLPMPMSPQIQGPAQATSDSLEERKYAYLDRDAQRLLIFLADQLPDFTAAPAAPHPPESPR